MTEAVQIMIGGLLQGCIFGLLALGFSLIYRVTAAINLAQGGFCIIGALLAFTLEQRFGMNVFVAGVLGVLGTSVVALFLGVVAFVPGLGRLPVSAMFILTVGLLTLLEGLTLVIWGSESYTLPTFSGERPLHFFGLLIPPQGLWLLAVTALIIAALAYVMARTRLGFAFRACAENTMAANLMGIGVKRMQLFSFVLAAATGGIGGIVIGPITSFQFDTGRLYTIFGFIAVVIGGISSPFGAVVGGLFLGVAIQLAAAYVSSLFSNALALALLLLMLVWRPTGLFVGGPARRQDVREEPRVQRSIVRLDPKRGRILAAVAAILLFLVLPLSIPPGGLLSSIVITEILFVGAIGLDVLMGFAGQISLGQAGFMAIGGYTAGILAVHFHTPPLLGTLAGMAISLLCALVLAFGTMRLRGLYLAIATMAFGLLVDSLTNGLDLTGGPSGLVGIPAFSIGGFNFDTPLRNFYLVAFILVIVLAALSAGLRGGFGRALKAIRADPLASAALGIPVRRYKVAAFAISALLGSLSGSLYAFNFHFLSPEMVGTPVSLLMLSMLIIGGEGTLFGPVLGVALITLLPEIFAPLAQYKTMSTGLLLIMFSLYLPSGIFGALIALIRRGVSAIPSKPSALRRVI
jgi:branched-chain amino acid transport system permease protein